MKTKFQFSVMTVLLGVSSISHAALSTSSGAVSFSGTASVTATGSGVTSAINNNNGASIANVALNQFNNTTGVLTGVDLQLNSNRTQTINGIGNKNNGPGRTANGSGNSDGGVSAPGVNIIAPAISQSGSGCSLAQGPTGPISCSWGPNTSTVTTNSTGNSVNNASLDSYAGSGSVNAALSLPALSATTTLSSVQGQAGSGSSTTYQVAWNGSLQANYSYLLHADGSFNGLSDQNNLTLDFGTVLQGASVSPLTFSIYNLTDPNRVALDLDSISLGTGDVSKLTTDLSGFSNLAPGGSNAFNAYLNTSTAGLLNAQYIINLSDEDIGASSTRQTQQLTLNLTANVAAVPLPGAIWFFGSVLMGVLGFGRHKRVI